MSARIFGRYFTDSLTSVLPSIDDFSRTRQTRREQVRAKFAREIEEARAKQPIKIDLSFLGPVLSKTKKEWEIESKERAKKITEYVRTIMEPAAIIQSDYYEPPEGCQDDSDDGDVSTSCVVIDKALFIGGIGAVSETIERLNIKLLIQVVQDRMWDDLAMMRPNFEGVELVDISCDDTRDGFRDLSSKATYGPQVDGIIPLVFSDEFDFICDKISKALLKDEPVHIYCHRGKSRSVTILRAYLMIEFGLSYEEAKSFVQHIRPCAKPNEDFEYELAELGERLAPST